MSKADIVIKAVEVAAEEAARLPGLSELIPQGERIITGVTRTAGHALREQGFANAADLLPEAEKNPLTPPGLRADHNVSLDLPPKPISDLQAGDLLRVGRSDSGHVVTGTDAKWEPSQAGFYAEHTRWGQTNPRWFPAATVNAGEDAALLGKDGKPVINGAADAQVGDTIRFSEVGAHLPGDYKITDREMQPPKRALPEGEYHVSHVGEDRVHLTMPNPYEPGETLEFHVPTTELRGPMFHRVETPSATPED